jgi:arylsulfatase A
MLYKLIGFACVSALSVFGSEQNIAASESKPNIVILYADDLGYGEIQALNPVRGKIPTPHINALAEEGMVFTDAHTASSVCTPSRYALLTGRYAWRTYLQVGVSNGGADSLIAEGRLTLASMLKEAGYNTAISGKWHLDFNYDGERCTVGTSIPDGPITRGFDTWFGFHHAREMRELCKDDKVIEVISPKDMLPRTTDFAVEYINEKAEAAKNGKPFFLYMAFGSPHVPHLPTDEWVGKSGLGKYGDFVMMTDGMAGKIIDAIDANGLTDNTIILFTSDNGTSKAANFEDLNQKGHYPSAHFRGCKTDIWEGAHRVPFIIRWPNGAVEAGSTCNALVGLSDMSATLAELVGYALPDNAAEDSISFLPALSGKPVAHPRDDIIHHSGAGRFSIRRGKWKLILAPGSGGLTAPDFKTSWQQGLPEMQLYDLEQDVAEENNLQARYPEMTAELVALLQQQVNDGRSTPGAAQSNDTTRIDIWKRPSIKK